MPYCSRCGQQVEETALFCSNCGAPQKPQTGRSAPTFYSSSRSFRSGQYGEFRGKLREIIERFRQKGAQSPEKAMTLQELGLPPRFEEAMHRRLGQSGIFVEVNGKYYLNEEWLRQIWEQRAKRDSRNGGGDSWGRSNPPTWFRVVGILLMLPIGLIIALLLYYVFGFQGGFFSGEFLLIFVSVSIILVIARLLFHKARRRYWREQWGRSEL